MLLQMQVWAFMLLQEAERRSWISSTSGEHG